MYRAYFFGNYYLSQVQQGVQGIHVTSNYMKKYCFGEQTDSVHYNGIMDALKQWACHDVTAVLLNGGNAASLRNLISLFDDKDNPFPWTFFNEDEVSLDGALTSVGIILPECLAKADPETVAQLVAAQSAVNKHGKLKKKHYDLLSDSAKSIVKVCPNIEFANKLISAVQSCRTV